MTVNIPLKNKPYPVYIKNGLFHLFRHILEEDYRNSPLALVVDKKVLSLYRDTLAPIAEQGILIELEASEKNKNISTVATILEKLADQSFGRDGVIIAAGGGVTGDIAGFAASIYARGVKYIQLPTTILAAADSSVGGKTGVNLGQTKNLAGTFHQPELVFIETSFFQTLPEDEVLCGIGEMIKYAIIGGAEMFDLINDSVDGLLQKDNKLLVKVIAESVRIKGDVVAADEKETGLRKILNLGHTFGHALEIEMDHRIKHGAAVAAGISCALELSRKLDLLDDGAYEKISGLLQKLRTRIKVDPVNPENIYTIMKRDKKNREGNIKFVLVKNIGEVLIDVEADKPLVLESVKEGLEIFR